MSTLWHYPSRTSPADQGVAHPPRCMEGWLWSGWLSWCVTCSNHMSFRLLAVAKRFLWTHKEVDLAPHAIRSLVLQVGDKDKFSTYTWFTEPASCLLDSASRVHVSQSQRRMEMTKDSCNLNLLAKLTYLCQKLFNLTSAAFAETILMRNCCWPGAILAIRHKDLQTISFVVRIHGTLRISGIAHCFLFNSGHGHSYSHNTGSGQNYCTTQVKGKRLALIITDNRHEVSRRWWKNLTEREIK